MQAFGKKLRPSGALSKSVHTGKVHFQDRQVLSYTVMKIAGEPALFLILGLQETDC